MKKYFTALFLLVVGSLNAYPRCSPDMERAVRAVYHFPEGRKLLAEVEADGPIQIYRAPFNSNSHAMWVATDRAIVINANSHRSFGEVVRSIFFELHNALTNEQFAALDMRVRQKQIAKSDYVEAVERLEHQNAYNTSRAIDHAIRHGFFPQDSWWPIPADFHAHFQVQIESGHSAKIASSYDSMSREGFYGYSR